jgi:hypothetical protein
MKVENKTQKIATMSHFAKKILNTIDLLLNFSHFSEELNPTKVQKKLP